MQASGEYLTPPILHPLPVTLQNCTELLLTRMENSQLVYCTTGWYRHESQRHWGETFVRISSWFIASTPMESKTVHLVMNSANCTVVYCIALNGTVLYCTALHCTFDIELHCTAPHRMVQHYTAQHYTALDKIWRCSAQSSITLRYSLWNSNSNVLAVCCPQ